MARRMEEGRYSAGANGEDAKTQVDAMAAGKGAQTRKCARSVRTSSTPA